MESEAQFPNMCNRVKFFKINFLNNGLLHIHAFSVPTVPRSPLVYFSYLFLVLYS